MKYPSLSGLLATFLALTLPLTAEVPQMIHYQGRVATGGVNFNGTGQFRFALVDGTGATTYWSNDGTSVSGGAPSAAVSLPVVQGLYSVKLGDITLMNSISPAAFDHPAVYLRVWFDDEVNGSQLMSPDARITSVAYAMTAENAVTANLALSVPDGSVTAAKLAPGVINSSSNSGPPAGALQVFDTPPSRAELLAPEWSPVNPATAATVIQAENWQALTTLPSGPIFSLDSYGAKSHVAVWTGTALTVFGARLDTDNNADWYTGAGRLPITTTAGNVWSQLNLANAPAGRWHAVGVWTGSAMLVWGGERQDYVDDMVFGDGGIYSPASDSWTVLPPTDAPSPRTLAAAVWSGNEMLVWGGRSTVHYPFNGSGWLGDGKRFNPATGLWNTISASGAPSARGRHSAIWTGTEMLVFGGYGASGESADAAAYNPATDTWRPLPTANAPSGRVFHSTIWSGTEMLVWGGSAPSTGLIRDDGAIYNPTTDEWRAIPPLIPNTDYDPERRERHTAVWTGREMIIWGGYGGTTQFPDAVMGYGYAYRPDLNEWRSLPDTASDPGPRFGSDSVWTGSRAYIYAGKTGFSTYTSGTGSFYLPSRLGYYYLKQ